MGLRRERRDLFPFSRSLCESALRWKVVWRVFWFVDASILTLNFVMTCFMISPRVAGLPSLPEVERSMEERVKDSVTWLGCTVAGLMRGPTGLPHAGAAGLLAEAEEGARVGKASWEAVSTG